MLVVCTRRLSNSSTHQRSHSTNSITDRCPYQFADDGANCRSIECTINLSNEFTDSSADTLPYSNAIGRAYSRAFAQSNIFCAN